MHLEQRLGRRTDHRLQRKSRGALGTSRVSHGRIIDGSGEFAGVTGEFDMDWVFIDSIIEPGKVLGNSSKLRGTWEHP